MGISRLRAFVIDARWTALAIAVVAAVRDALVRRPASASCRSTDAARTPDDGIVAFRWYEKESGHPVVTKPSGRCGGPHLALRGLTNAILRDLDVALVSIT